MKHSGKDDIVRSFRNRLLGFFRRYQLSDQTFLIIVAVIVGFLGGLGSIGFEWMVETGWHFFFDIIPDLVGNPKWLVILIPAFGAIFLAPLIYFFPEEAKSDGVPATMQAVALKGGIIKVRTFSTRMLAWPLPWVRAALPEKKDPSFRSAPPLVLRWASFSKFPERG